MIVKNEEANLPRSLRHARMFHRCLVVDTGSTDNTKELARSLGAEVVDFEWCDNFAAARNVWHDHVKDGWIFWLDADDEIDIDVAQKVLALTVTETDNTVGALFDYKYPNDFVVEHIRLYRADLDITWQNRIHEHLNFLGPQTQAIKTAHGGPKIVRSHLTVYHPGYPTYDPDANRLRAERNFRLLLRELEDKPNDALVLHYIAEHHAFEGNLEKAIETYERVLSLADDTEVFWLPGCYVDLARCYYKAGRRRKSKDTLRRGYRRFGGDFMQHVERNLALKGKDGETAFDKARRAAERNLAFSH